MRFEVKFASKDETSISRMAVSEACLFRFHLKLGDDIRWSKWFLEVTEGIEFWMIYVKESTATFS